MRVGLDAEERSSLERLVERCRGLLEEDLAAQAAGRFGIDRDGTLASESELALDDSGIVARRDLLEVVDHFVSEGDSRRDAVGRMLREATFTHLNRLVAIRVAESHGLLPPSIASGRGSSGYRGMLELAPLLATDNTAGYALYLSLCGDELAGDVPALFDPRNPLLALSPRPTGLDRLVELLGDPAHAGLWGAPDCLGWVYQFFNTAQERKAMRDASPAPRDSRELAVRNQFFTPRYVVDFLVQNTLGRRLIEADPASPLLADLPLLVDPPEEPGSAVSLDEVAVLDPACGSGHFLLATYDVLERAFEHQGVSPREAAPRILHALWGIDIDPRCVQVASAALSFRARRADPDLVLPRPNVICARSLPAAASGMVQLQEALPSRLRAFVARMTELLDRASILGPLLKVEAKLGVEARGSFFGGIEQGRLLPVRAEQQSLAEAIPDRIASIEEELLGHLRQLADATTSSPTERLLAAEASDAVRFIEALRHRFDAVVMNPPFGEPVPESKDYLRAAYQWLPGRTSDLLAAFVGRGVELCKPGGYVGAITNRTGLFIKTFEAWRRHVLLGNELVCLADLGFGVMEGAMVEAAAYVVRAKPPGPRSAATFVRLLKDKDRPRALAEAISHRRDGAPDHRVTSVEQVEFERLPQAPIAYAMGGAVRQLIAEGPALEGHAGEARVGLQTGEDFRFVRAFWEVDPARIAQSREETLSGKTWVPFAKGGDYAPYWADIHLVVNWGNDGEELRAFPGSVLRNTQYYFRPGITWPPRTNSGLSFRVLPSGGIFGHKGPSIFGDELFGLLAWLNSRVIRLLVDATSAAAEETRSGTPSRSYEVGIVQSLPAPPITTNDELLVDEAAALGVLIAHADQYNETCRRFICPAIAASQPGAFRDRCLQAAQHHAEAVAEATERYARIDERIAELLGLDRMTLEEMDDVTGPLVARLPDDELSGVLTESACTMLTGSERALIEATVEAWGKNARFIHFQHQVMDRRIELVALALRRSPRALSRFLVERELVSPDGLTDLAKDLLSYLVGAAFGRWDVRYATGERVPPDPPSLFDAVPRSAPGQLVDEDGLPTTAPPPGYPLELPPTGVLLDEPGHPFDIEKRVVDAASVVLGPDAETVLREALEVLGARSVRHYLRRGFFRDHLARYSKSRRHAPIYWPVQAPSGNWGVWLYAPRLSREVLFAVAQAAAAREAAAAAEVSRLQRDRETGGGGRAPRQVAAVLDAEEALAAEVQAFRVEAERVAGLGWEPDLGDGAVLCAAPLANLFPAWSEPENYRRELKDGKHPWATVAKWAEEL